MASQSGPTISIIGAGLSGLALALYLHRISPEYAVQIYEVRPETHTSSSGTINLTPNALRVLDHLGVYKTVKTQGFNFDNLTLLDYKSDFLASIPIAGGTCEYQSLRLERRAVHGVLLDAVKQEGIPINYGCKCVSVSECSEGVKAAFANGIEIVTDFLIACDGIHSQVRKYLVSDPDAQKSHYNGKMSIGGYISAAEIESYTNKSVKYPIAMFGPPATSGSNFMIWPYDNAGNELTFFSTLEGPEEPKDWKTWSEDREMLKRVLLETFDSEGSEWSELVKNTIRLSDTERYRFWPHYTLPLQDRFYSTSGKVIAIGDAAHAMPPSGGQGGAIAFEDAETLAWAFHHLLKVQTPAAPNANDHIKVLEAWSRHRMTRIRAIQAMNKQVSQMRKSMPRVLYWFRMWFIWIMGSLGRFANRRKAVNDYDGEKEMKSLYENWNSS